MADYVMGCSTEDVTGPDEPFAAAKPPATDRILANCFGCKAPSFKRRRRRKKSPNPKGVPLTAEDVADSLRLAIKRGLKSYLRIGDHLIKRKQQLGHGEFGRLFKDSANPISEPLQLSRRQAQNYMHVAQDQRIRLNLGRLPSDLETLVTLSRLDTQAFNEWLESGVIHDRLTRARARQLVPKRETPKNNASGQPTQTTTRKDQIAGASPVLGIPFTDEVVARQIKLTLWNLVDECGFDLPTITELIIHVIDDLR